MPKHFHRAIDELMRRLVGLSVMVEAQVQRALDALGDRSLDACERVIMGDVEIDREEVLLEEECLKILALHQPVASDLRFVIATLKINNDLERIGDLAVDIAEHASQIIVSPTVMAKYDFQEMYTQVKKMLHDSIDALINHDMALAHKVILEDDQVDEQNRRMSEEVINDMRLNGQHAQLLINYVYISRRLERMADQVTNIAEDIVYLLSGEIVRHGHSVSKAKG